jgi:hypothetical protein
LHFVVHLADLVPNFPKVMRMRSEISDDTDDEHRSTVYSASYDGPNQASEKYTITFVLTLRVFYHPGDQIGVVAAVWWSLLLVINLGYNEIFESFPAFL